MARRGISLIEVVAVVLALAVVGALAYRRVMAFDQSERITSTAAQADAFAKAITLYQREHGEFPPDAEPGRLPPELAGYISAQDWATPPGIGGEWDWNGPPTFEGGTIGLAIRNEAAPRDLWRAFDDAADDGSTYQGVYRIWGDALFRQMGEDGAGPAGIKP
jgi:type II secretory pathway pseudopilin PulG